MSKLNMNQARLLRGVLELSTDLKEQARILQDRKIEKQQELQRLRRDHSAAELALNQRQARFRGYPVGEMAAGCADEQAAYAALTNEISLVETDLARVEPQLTVATDDARQAALFADRLLLAAGTRDGLRGSVTGLAGISFQGPAQGAP